MTSDLNVMSNVYIALKQRSETIKHGVQNDQLGNQDKTGRIKANHVISSTHVRTSDCMSLGNKLHVHHMFMVKAFSMAISRRGD